MKTLIIDTDTAADDAVALVMALRSLEVDVAAVTVVNGNVPVDLGVRNALIVADLCDVDVPVFRGAAQPLIRLPHDAKDFHGADGLGNQNYPDPTRKAQAGHAVDAIIDIANANPGAILVTLGPLTNIALAVSRAPEIVDKIARCVVMGGAACTYGNITPAAEYNIWCDPEAARIVFHSGLPIEMVGWELCIGEHALDDSDVQTLRDLDTPFSHFAVDVNRIALESFAREHGQRAIALPDPVTVAIAIDPAIVTESGMHYVDVETQSDLTRGMTVVDKLDNISEMYPHAPWPDVVHKGNKISVTWAIDIRRWKKLLFDLLA